MARSNRNEPSYYCRYHRRRPDALRLRRKANEPFTANELLAEPNGFTTIAFVALITHKDICTDKERSEAFDKYILTEK